MLLTLAAALLLCPIGLKAQEDAASVAGKGAAARPKPAIELGAPFCDNAILQREMPVPVWGWSTPGAKVTVEFAGQKKTATAGADGEWTLKLDTLAASAAPRELAVSDSAGNKVVLKNILVGEVWICSGQSNMQYGWGKESLPIFNWGGDAALAALAADAKTKPIRSYTVQPDVSLTPNKNCSGTWSKDVSGSAVAFGFSYHLHQKTTDGAAPAGFQLAGSDKVWHPATAAIKGNAVELAAEGLAAPAFVRYAFSGKPTVNLVNGANLPAYPFRTDDWPK
jgi:hypothetical protein